MLGKWQGSYQGSGAGKFEIGLSQDPGSQPTGYVAIQPEGAPEFPSIPFNAVTLEGNTVKGHFYRLGRQPGPRGGNAGKRRVDRHLETAAARAAPGKRLR
jgi:hypothetical protein